MLSMTDEELRSRLRVRLRYHQLPYAEDLKGQGIHILPVETDQDFRALREQYAAILAPAGSLESELVSRIVLALWRLQRYQNIEAVLLGCAGAAHRNTYWTIPSDDHVARRAFGFQDLALQSQVLPILNQFLDRLGREYHAAMQNFLLLRHGVCPLPTASTSAVKPHRRHSPVIAIKDPPIGRKPSQPSVRPPEPLTGPSEIAA